MHTELRYENGTAELRTLRSVSAAEWSKVRLDPHVRGRLEDAGIAVADMPDDDVFEISAGSSGFDPSGSDVLIAVGSWAVGVLGDAAKEILLDIWRERVKPKILDRLGEDAVGRERD